MSESCWCGEVTLGQSDESRTGETHLHTRDDCPSWEELAVSASRRIATLETRLRQVLRFASKGRRPWHAERGRVWSRKRPERPR